MWSVSSHIINLQKKINVNLRSASSGTYIVHVTNNKGWSELRKVFL
jgi:hypothetical protein